MVLNTFGRLNGFAKMHPYCEHSHRVWRYQKQTLGLLARSRTMGASSLAVFLQALDSTNRLHNKRKLSHQGWISQPLHHRNQRWITLQLDYQNQGWIPLPLDHQKQGWIFHPWITSPLVGTPTLGSPKPGVDTPTLGSPQPDGERASG